MKQIPLFLLAFVLVTTSPTWIPCASEGETCVINKEEYYAVVVSYCDLLHGRCSYKDSLNADIVCDDFNFGDISPGVNSPLSGIPDTKSCSYYGLPFSLPNTADDVTNYAGTWVEIAQEREGDLVGVYALITEMTGLGSSQVDVATWIEFSQELSIPFRQKISYNLVGPLSQTSQFVCEYFGDDITSCAFRVRYCDVDRSTCFYRFVNSGFICWNNFFGDPAIGEIKYCDILTDPIFLSYYQVYYYNAHGISGGYTKDTVQLVAQENEYFDIPGSGSHWVRFGSSEVSYDSIYFYRALSGNGFLCGNSLFGADPSVGIVKSCWILGLYTYVNGDDTPDNTTKIEALAYVSDENAQGGQSPLPTWVIPVAVVGGIMGVVFVVVVIILLIKKARISPVDNTYRLEVS